MADPNHIRLRKAAQDALGRLMALIPEASHAKANVELDVLQEALFAHSEGDTRLRQIQGQAEAYQDELRHRLDRIAEINALKR
jgi:hypothetical protein